MCCIPHLLVNMEQKIDGDFTYCSKKEQLLLLVTERVIVLYLDVTCTAIIHLLK
jgi:hypothetical protein